MTRLTVREMIEVLQQFNPDATVELSLPDVCLGGDAGEESIGFEGCVDYRVEGLWSTEAMSASPPVPADCVYIRLTDDEETAIRRTYGAALERDRCEGVSQETYENEFQRANENARIANDMRRYAVNADRIAMELTAAIVQMSPGYEAGEAEFLSRDRVMELITRWRMKWDALQKDRPTRSIPTGTNQPCPHPASHIRIGEGLMSGRQECGICKAERWKLNGSSDWTGWSTAHPGCVNEIDTSSRKRLAKLAERCRTSDVRPAEVAMILESVLSAPQRGDETPKGCTDPKGCRFWGCRLNCEPAKAALERPRTSKELGQ
jgi:hypothetical protein